MNVKRIGVFSVAVFLLAMLLFLPKTLTAKSENSMVDSDCGITNVMMEVSLSEYSGLNQDVPLIMSIEQIDDDSLEEPLVCHINENEITYYVA